MHGNVATSETLLVLWRYAEWLVTGSGEHRQEKRFALLGNLTGLLGKVLEIRFVIYCPRAIKVLLVRILIHAVVALKTNQISKTLEPQCGVRRAMEKLCSVALFTKHLWQPLQGIVRVDIITKRVDIARYSGKCCRHAVDRAHAVGKAILETIALSQQRVEEGSVALIFSSIPVLIIKTSKLHRETLHQEHYHIEFAHLSPTGMLVPNGIENRIQFIIFKELRIFVSTLVHGGDESEWRVKNYRRLVWTLAIELGRILAQGVHLQRQSSPHASNG